jgi:chemotaxis protein MotB
MKVVEMGTQANAAPVVIKRKKIIAGGHHGGAWKVAIAWLPFDMVSAFPRQLMVPSPKERLTAF